MVHLSQSESGAWSKESNSALNLVKEVLGEERDTDLILFFLERSEDSLDLRCLIWHQNSSLRLEFDFISVLFGHSPLVFNWDTGLVLDWELLLG